MPETRILIVDDEPSMRSALCRTLRTIPAELVTACDGIEALDLLHEHPRDAFAVAIVDLRMPRMDGLALLAEIRRFGPATQILMLTGAGTIETAVQAMRMGASDFIEKPFDPEALRDQVLAALQIWKAKRPARQAGDESATPGCEFVGDSKTMQEMRHLAQRLGDSDALVLIQGESGTGKEQFAKSVHQHGKRAEEPFVPIDTSALGATVVESELFGHTKGAFTGAQSGRQGLLRAAGRGTVFLDEVGDLPLGMQTRLLRVLQERTVRPVGTERVYPIEARLMAATNRDLLEAVARGEFRDDLYHRLNVVTVTMPPLREHKEDLAPLAAHFLAKYGKKRAELSGISAEASAALHAHDWPGNVRELENAILRAVVIGSSTLVEAGDLPLHIVAGVQPGPPGSANEAAEIPDDAPAPQVAGGTLAACEREAIVTALHTSNGNRTMAAEILGIGVATLYRKIRKYDIRPPEPTPSR